MQQPRITYLGHAGFLFEYGGIRMLMDPWFYGAILGSWFPYPYNRFLVPELAAAIPFPIEFAKSC
jgi:UDP-MurNAc hydroxylase